MSYVSWTYRDNFPMAFWGPCSLTFFQCCLWAVRCHHSHSTTCICPLCKPSESSPYLYHFKILVSRCWALTHSYSLKSNLSMTGIFLVLLLGIISYSPFFSFPVHTVTWMLDWIFNVFFFFFFFGCCWDFLKFTFQLFVLIFLFHHFPFWSSVCLLMNAHFHTILFLFLD